jgi:hypothetical protein
MLPTFDGPIPGENYTSDTKNYPWHRPPEITDYNQAVERMVDDMLNPEIGYTFMPILEAGYTIATAADIYVTQGIMDGKWTPDFAILLAGPTARMLQILAKGQGIEAPMGVEMPIPIVDPEFLASVGGIGASEIKEDQEDVVEDAPMVETPAGGFMAAPEVASANEQMEMLGYGGAEEPVMDVAALPPEEVM